jgi:predicted dehydrogenase
VSGGKDAPSQDSYALVAGNLAEIAAPELPYRPPMPRDRSVPIGLIGAGGISAAHLDAYRASGFNVVAICDRSLSRAEMRRDEFYPSARITDEPGELIEDPAIPVLDLALHPAARTPLIRQSLEAGKHVLSQKPFVMDLAVGAELVRLAANKDVFLAVNQNGRWAPYMSYMREAVRAGLIGEVIGVHAQLQWDHSWIGGTPFEDIDQIILEDFAIHWFDFVASVIGDTASSVYATGTRAHGQSVRSKLLAQAMIGFPGGQASLVFDGAAAHGPHNLTTIAGTKGTLRSIGPDLGVQSVRLYLAEGVAVPRLEGQWFNDGFAGAMGALLVAIETGAAPINDAAANLNSLKLVKAALESAEHGRVVIPG